MSVEVLQTLSLVAYILAALLFLVAVVLFFYLKVPALWGEVSGRTARKAIKAMKWKNEEASSKTIPASSGATGGGLSAKLAEAAQSQTQASAQEPPVPQERVPLVAAEQKPPLKTAPVAEPPADHPENALPTAPTESKAPVELTETKASMKSAATTPSIDSAEAQPLNAEPSEGADPGSETGVLPSLGEAACLSDTDSGQTTVLPSSEVGLTELLQTANVGTTAILPQSGIGETAVLNAAAYNEFISHSTGELPRADETSLLYQEQKPDARITVDPLFTMEKELAFTDSTEIIE